QELVESDVPLASEEGGVGIHLAEHAFALQLALTSGLHTAIRKPDYSLREPIRIRQLELYDLTMGIVGFRGTGREVARRALGFGDDLLKALDEEMIGGAGLDVTDPEPLPDSHRLWNHPRAIVTPHTAGGSPRRAGRVIETFCENLRRMRGGQPLIALIDKRKGY